MVNRRQFLGALALPAAHSLGIPEPSLLAAPGFERALRKFAELDATPSQSAGDEELWREVQQAFTVDRSRINLNNGGCSPSPRVVQESMRRHLDFSNDLSTYNLWQVLEPQREPLRERMARQWGCDPEELAFTRNASEGLETCQFGFDLRAGDEVLTTDQDYPRMITSFRQRERREGIVLRQIALPVPCEDDDEVVKRFEQALTPRTKLILLCHMINLTGQILPVKRVVALGRAKRIPVVVDGAHAFAHFDFKLSDLDCDYYATALHKWLFAPHGTGLLYVRRDKIKGLWPLMGAPVELDEDIRKFEEIGTHPAANTLSIAEALTFHQGLGPARKEARLRYLRDFWAKRLQRQGRIRIHTSLDPRFSCGIATVEIEDLDTRLLQSHLWTRHRIMTVAIVHEQFQGLRISPSVYTTLEELERFCEAMEHAIQHGIPA
jgi:selenocysteine lyase/cysteine desulfurase